MIDIPANGHRAGDRLGEEERPEIARPETRLGWNLIDEQVSGLHSSDGLAEQNR